MKSARMSWMMLGQIRDDCLIDCVGFHVFFQERTHFADALSLRIAALGFLCAFYIGINTYVQPSTKIPASCNLS